MTKKLTAYEKAKKATLKEVKARAKADNWKTIDDSKVRHIWTNPDGTGEIAVEPDWYANNGTPVCDWNTDWDGQDMVYARTEILDDDADKIAALEKRSKSFFAEDAKKDKKRLEGIKSLLTFPK